MFELEHRVRVFVFAFGEDGIRYLLLRRKPLAEWPLGPVVGPVGVGEHLQDAILREVETETGLTRPEHILEIHRPQKELFGDVGLIEWPYAYQAGGESTVSPGPEVGEFAWLDFDSAFRNVGGRRDRDALVNLQLRLAG